MSDEPAVELISIARQHIMFAETAMIRLEMRIAEKNKRIAELEGRNITDQQIAQAILSKRPRDIARVRDLLESQ